MDKEIQNNDKNKSLDDFNQLSEEEMEQLQGSGDLNSETITTVTTSSAACGAAIGGGAALIASKLLKCGK